MRQPWRGKHGGIGENIKAKAYQVDCGWQYLDDHVQTSERLSFYKKFKPLYKSLFEGHDRVGKGNN